MAVQTLASLRKKFFGFPEPVYKSSAWNYTFNECNDWPLTGNVAKNGLTRNTDYEAHIDAKISLTSHVSYSDANWSYQIFRAANLTAKGSDPTYLFRQNLEQKQNTVIQKKSDLLPNTKTRSRLTLLKKFPEKIQFRPQRVKKELSKISYLQFF